MKLIYTTCIILLLLVMVVYNDNEVDNENDKDDKLVRPVHKAKAKLIKCYVCKKICRKVKTSWQIVQCNGSCQYEFMKLPGNILLLLPVTSLTALVST